MAIDIAGLSWYIIPVIHPDDRIRTQHFASSELDRAYLDDPAV
jgi:hypothetical protein